MVDHYFHVGDWVWLIQVDISGHRPFPTGSKQFACNFGNLLFLAVFNFQGYFEGLNEDFLGLIFSMIVHLLSSLNESPQQYLSNELSCTPKEDCMPKVTPSGS
jgi:hypothetical protein